MRYEKNQKIHDFIDKVCSQIKCKSVHEAIRLELEDHIAQIAETYILSGMPEDEAVNNAIMQMGDPLVIGKQLHHTHRQQPDWGILVLAGLFISLGLIAMYFIEANGVLQHPISLFARSSIFSLFGLIIATGFYFFNYAKIRQYAVHLYVFTVLVLLWMLFNGVFVNGRAWLTIGPLSINFIDASPFLLTVSLAGFFCEWNWNEPKKMLYGLLLLIIPSLIFINCNSMVATITYLTAFFVLMIASNAKLWQVITLSSFSILLFILSIFQHPYRVERLLNFITPYKDPLGSGYLPIQLNRMIHRAGFFGQGFNFPTQTIPDIHTDFIFTYIVYSFGWIMGAILVALAIVFIVRMTRIVKRVEDPYGKMLVTGLTVLFTVQFFFNILMNLGLVPIIGIGLPFISYGGSLFTMNMIALGLISSIYRRKNAWGCFPVSKK